jgi:exopolysaccharide production negative regulator
MLMCNRLALGAFGALLVLGLSPVKAGGDEPPPFTSATEAYRQGTSSLKSGQTAASLPALEYAAKRGVLGAQLKLARIYATGRDSVAEDDSKAFSYFQQIADQQADISPSSPIAKYAAEAFVALGQYYADGIPAMQLAPNRVYAVDLFRHAASYFGDAEAQYRLARLYMNGDGVEKNMGLAVNWLATAAKKQHAAAQATLGEILWRGQDVRPRQARGLALIILAHQHAVADGKEPQWIGDLYREALDKSDTATRKDAEAMLPELSGVQAATLMPTAKAKPTEVMVMPAGGATAKAAPPTTSAAADTVPLSKPSAPPPAPIGMSVGFGAPSPKP